MNGKMSYGLASFGYALGTPTAVSDIVHEYTDEIERVLGYGYQTIHRCDSDI